MDIFKLPKEVLEILNRNELDLKANRQLGIPITQRTKSDLIQAANLLPNQIEGITLDLQSKLDLLLKKEGLRYPLTGLQFSIANDTIKKNYFKSTNPTVNVIISLAEQSDKFKDLISIPNNQDYMETALYINSFPFNIWESMIMYANEKSKTNNNISEFPELDLYNVNLNKLKPILDQDINLVTDIVNNLSRKAISHTVAAATLDRELSPIEQAAKKVEKKIADLIDKGYNYISIFNIKSEGSTLHDYYTTENIQLNDQLLLGKNAEDLNSLESYEELPGEKFKAKSYPTLQLTELKELFKAHIAFNQIAFDMGYEKVNNIFSSQFNIDNIEDFLQKLEKSEKSPMVNEIIQEEYITMSRKL